MNIKTVRAFSLIELMVVIAIVGVLAAVAIPSYKDYIVKANVQSALGILNAQAMIALDYYNRNGSFPAYGNNILVTPPTGPVYYVYGWNGCTPAYSGDCLQIVAIFNNGVIPSSSGGITPSATPGIGNALVMIVFANINGTSKIYCGSDSRVAMNLPTMYLPPSCVANLYGTGTFPSGIP